MRFFIAIHFFFSKIFFFPLSFAHFWRSLISFINNTWTPLALSDMFSPRHHFCFFFFVISSLLLSFFSFCPFISLIFMSVCTKGTSPRIIIHIMQLFFTCRLLCCCPFFRIWRYKPRHVFLPYLCFVWVFFFVGSLPIIRHHQSRISYCLFLYVNQIWRRPPPVPCIITLRNSWLIGLHLCKICQNCLQLFWTCASAQKNNNNRIIHVCK